MYNTKRAYLLHITFPHHLCRCPLPGVRNSPTYNTLKFIVQHFQTTSYFVIRNQCIEILSHFATAGHSVKNFCSSHNPVDTAWVSCAFVWLCVCCWIAMSTYPYIDFLRVDYFPNYLQVSPNLLASGASRGGSVGSMEPLFWRAAFENTVRKRTTYTTLTLELRTSASQ